ncbi:MAG TPA: carbamate kinase [Ideonella sp.]|uniref:carbamate kinase n=1 Tax=Ideonella sp. TaxID=1929293 RepID=UPI002E31C98F|nr:carbamate kinase [Ideonella sp.]HEX5685295.1 carbamate kinase [Ideonella sp.]
MTPAANETEAPLLVVALGGNALLRRGEPLEAAAQLRNIRHAAQQIALLAHRFRLVVAHGNGPQVGLLALQNEAYHDVRPYPLDVLGAQTEGMIGYLLEQEIANCLSPGRSVATLLTRVEVDRADPAFSHPSKPIGPVYDLATGHSLAAERGWRMMADGAGLRRAVPSPKPRQIIGLRSVRALLAHGTVVVCAGGGGIPVAATGHGNEKQGVEAVIDKDLAAGLLARQLEADMLLIVTDVPAVCLNWGTPSQREIRSASPDALQGLSFAAGSIGPKVEAACDFARETSQPAVIGSLDDIERLVDRGAGTWVSVASTGIQLAA